MHTDSNLLTADKWRSTATITSLPENAKLDNITFIKSSESIIALKMNIASSQQAIQYSDTKQQDGRG